MRAVTLAAAVVASFIISSIAWGPPLALITKQPGAPAAPFNLSIIGPGNETGGMPSTPGSDAPLWVIGSNGSSTGMPEIGQSPAIPNPLAGLGETLGNVLNPGVSPERVEAPRSGLALFFAAAAPIIIALAYYALYARGRKGVVAVRRRRRPPKAPGGGGGSAVGGDNIFVRVVKLLSLKVSEALGRDPDILTHREVMNHAAGLVGLGDKVRAAVMGYEKLRFASREPSEEEVRAAEEVLRIASR